MLTAAERNEMLNTISDLSKCAFGFRVRKDYDAMTDDELRAEWDYFFQVAQESAEQEKQAEAQALAVWKARIATMQSDFGISCADAVRWDMQAMDCNDFDYYMWNVGLNTTLVKDLVEPSGNKDPDNNASQQ